MVKINRNIRTIKEAYQNNKIAMLKMKIIVQKDITVSK